MTLKEYIKSKITINKQADLALIYEELINAGYAAREVYTTVNEVIFENIEELGKKYKNDK